MLGAIFNSVPAVHCLTQCLLLLHRAKTQSVVCQRLQAFAAQLHVLDELCPRMDSDGHIVGTLMLDGGSTASFIHMILKIVRSYPFHLKVFAKGAVRVITVEK